MMTMDCFISCCIGNRRAAYFVTTSESFVILRISFYVDGVLSSKGNEVKQGFLSSVETHSKMKRNLCRTRFFTCTSLKCNWRNAHSKGYTN